MNYAALGAVLWWLCGGAFAAQAGESSPSPVTASPVAGMLQVMLGLAVVLLVLAAVVWLLRRFVPGQVAAGGAMKVIGGVMVGPKERVVLVEVGDTWLVLGVGTGRVNALHSMSKPQNLAIQSDANMHGGFSAWLNQALRRRGG